MKPRKRLTTEPRLTPPDPPEEPACSACRRYADCAMAWWGSPCDLFEAREYDPEAEYLAREDRRRRRTR